MRIQVDPVLRDRIPGLTFGIVSFRGIHVQERAEHLWAQIEELCQRYEHEMRLEQLSTYEQVASVRGMQKRLGFDPTRYRPSSEALLRRVLKGQGIYQINTAVDTNNLCSLEYLVPMCVYDLSQIHGNVHARVGFPDEVYPGIGRQDFHIEGKILLADDEGVIGTAVSDSERTKVTTATTDMFMVMYIPPERSIATAQEYCVQAARRMIAYNGGLDYDLLTVTV